MSQNYPYNFHNNRGYYKPSSCLTDIDYSYESSTMSPIARTTTSSRFNRDTLNSGASDFNYRRELVRLRQKLEDRHNKIMQEKAAFQMFNEFKDNWLKTMSENPDLLAKAPEQNFENYPEKDTNFLATAYNSCQNLPTKVPDYNLPQPPTTPIYPTMPAFPKTAKPPVVPIVSEPLQEIDPSTSIAKYMEHIQRLESEKEVFETVVRALVEYQKRKQNPPAKPKVNLITDQNDMETFKDEYLRKLDDVRNVAEDIKESVADFRYQMLMQQTRLNKPTESVTPTKESVSIDEPFSEKDIGQRSTECKATGTTSSGSSKAFNNIDYTMYEESKSNQSCGLRAQQSSPHGSSQNIIREKQCDTCHGYLMQKKYHENLKKLNDSSVNDSTIANKFSATERQFADPQSSETEDDVIKNIIEPLSDVATKELQMNPLLFKQKSENTICSHLSTNKHNCCVPSNRVLCHCGDAKNSGDTTTMQQHQYKQIEESKFVKCVKKVYNQQMTCTVNKRDETTITELDDNHKVRYKSIKDCQTTDVSCEGGDGIITTYNDTEIDPDTVVVYFVKRVKDLKEQCHKYRSMKDMLQKRVEEYSGMFANENRVVY